MLLSGIHELKVEKTVPLLKGHNYLDATADIVPVPFVIILINYRLLICY